jgi:hypothetical protein
MDRPPCAFAPFTTNEWNVCHYASLTCDCQAGQWRCD